MLALWNGQAEAESYLDALMYWTPAIQLFIDGTMVKQNKDAQAVVDVCYRLFLRYADFLCLMVAEEDNNDIKMLHNTFKRLDGLTTLENHKKREDAKKKKQGRNKEED